VQLVATLHLHDPCDLPRARDALSAAGFCSDEAIMAAIDNEAESRAGAAPIVTAAEAHASGLFSPFVNGYAASSPLPPSVVAYSHGMLAHAHAGSSASEHSVACDFSELSVSAAAVPVRAAHPERPDRLRAAGDVARNSAANDSLRRALDVAQLPCWLSAGCGPHSSVYRHAKLRMLRCSQPHLFQSPKFMRAPRAGVACC
jgi:hypothetical protein